MYAIIRDGGKQYRVEPGQTLAVERKTLTPGAELRFDQVLLVRDNGRVLVGSPLVEGAAVVAQVKSEKKAPKIIAFKFIRREGHHRKKGHRQRYTLVTVKDILLP